MILLIILICFTCSILQVLFLYYFSLIQSFFFLTAVSTLLQLYPGLWFFVHQSVNCKLPVNMHHSFWPLEIWQHSLFGEFPTLWGFMGENMSPYERQKYWIICFSSSLTSVVWESGLDPINQTHSQDFDWRAQEEPDGSSVSISGSKRIRDLNVELLAHKHRGTYFSIWLWSWLFEPGSPAFLTILWAI